MTDLCEPAVEMQALEMSHSLLLAAPAVTCHGWVLDREHSPSTLGATYCQVPPVGCAWIEWGRAPADRDCEGCGTGNLVLCFVPGPLLSGSVQQKWLK